MNDLLDDAVQYFKGKKVYNQLFLEFRKKFESLGRIGGTIKLDTFEEIELEPIALFFGTTVNALLNKNVLSLNDFECSLQQTKFEEIGLHMLLEAYFDEKVESKKSMKEAWIVKEDSQLEKLSEEYSSMASYFLYLHGRSRDSGWIIKMIFEAEFLLSVNYLAKALNELPVDYERLPFFSQRISGNPHTFDLSTVTGKLWIHLLHFKQNGGGPPPTNVEAINDLLLTVRLLRDDITNFVSFANLLGKKDGCFHPVWQAATTTRSVVNIPLRELLKIEQVLSSHDSENIYVVENSGVFSALLDEVPDIPLICTHGQFKLAGLRLIDLLVESGYILHYAGDFDPEGLSMAVRLLQRHPRNVKLWRMDIESYELSKPCVELEERLNKLEGIKHPSLLDLAMRIMQTGKAGYQEALLEVMIADIRMN
ncbi:TIGR02679 family protein [Sporosarcina limicola]|uniref:Uncharacterized protein (TIGR02679 family) n=1 Tax=Sporosarcina limicola TaxID=34101 RepID=A0A927ML04_9BACL|nr:TIGR02679 family protein [Sporosarcina limicola]MBE1556538.1 uncharacterized protein (TIGR02679 family) [Sporosarcina limicola]